MEKNLGSVTGVLQRITPYKTKAGRSLNRLDIVVPSVSPMDHPTTVCVHTEKDHQRNLNTECTITYRSMSFLKPGSGNGEGLYFDNTRLEEQ